MPPKRKAATAPKSSTPKKSKQDVGVEKAKISKSKVSSKESKSSLKNDAGGGSSVDFSSYLTDKQWQTALKNEFEEKYFQTLQSKLQADYKNGLQVFPAKENIFRALNLTPLDKVKVVILGQDPYHDDNQATGLAFSVPRGEKVPPSLKNMYKELEGDVKGFSPPSHGCLEAWAKEGVLLLNATLTVEAHKANSHKGYGWDKFTDKIIQVINDKCSGVVFLLWGNFAQKKGKHVNSGKHSVLNFAHPSPLSFNKFQGCRCFSKVNDLLKKNGKAPVDWNLPA